MTFCSLTLRCGSRAPGIAAIASTNSRTSAVRMLVSQRQALFAYVHMMRMMMLISIPHSRCQPVSRIDTGGTITNPSGAKGRCYIQEASYFYVHLHTHMSQ